MNELMPAFVGLLGVVVGGIIQIAFQAQRVRTEQAAEIRRQVSELSAAVSNYLNSLDRATEYMSREQVDKPDKERIAEDAKNVAELRHELLNLATKLIAVGDLRISDQSSVLVHEVSALSGLLQELWIKPNLAHRQIFLQGREPVSYQFNVLLAMVAPTVLDRHLRFRSTKAAKRHLNRSSRRRIA